MKGVDRRAFLGSVGTATAMLALPGNVISKEAVRSSNELIKTWIAQNDIAVARLLQLQQSKTSDVSHGGFPDAFGIYHVGPAAWNVNRMAMALIMPRSKFFQSEQLAASLELAMDFICRSQHPDGTIDLLTTNFHSTPDTGFVVQPIALALSCVRQQAPQQLVAFQESAITFLTNAGGALREGGIHTPNHRWVVCMALAWINRLEPDERLVARIDRWLEEAIDIDDEGHYTEHSTSVYSPIVNHCLIAVARLCGRTELLDPVRKNLNLTMYLSRANGEVVTEASRRQDQYRVGKMADYYYSYRYLSLRDGVAKFAAMARLIEETVGIENLDQQLSAFFDDATLQKEMPSGGRLPENFERSFPRSKLVRIRRGKLDATILADNETILTVCNGHAALRAVRMATAFFGKGQFISSSLEKADGKFVLRQKLEGPYLQPLPRELLPGDGDWSKMPRELRPISEVQKLDVVITIHEIDGGLKIHFHVSGTDNVPLAIELAFGHEGKLSGVTNVKDIADAYLLTDDSGTYIVGDDKLTFGPARAKHSWTQIRGASPKLDAQSVYITDFTPFDFELRITR